MKIQIDITKNILTQFAEQLHLSPKNHQIQFEETWGKGDMSCQTFAHQLECYLLRFYLDKSLQIFSSNPIGSNYFLLNINLSNEVYSKRVNDKWFDFQKHLPSSILCYPPDTQVYSQTPIKDHFKILLLRVPYQFLEAYQLTDFFELLQKQSTVIYEDLSPEAEQWLLNSQINDTLLAHANLLSFLHHFITKIIKREQESTTSNIHSSDIQHIFSILPIIRNPTIVNLPTIDELAKSANMGSTKFKQLFKQIFGTPPKKYHQNIKMSYAKNILLNKIKTPTEISYDLGYSHPSKFTRAFKKHFGITPSKLT